jgi:hypothetical protein
MTSGLIRNPTEGLSVQAVNFDIEPPSPHLYVTVYHFMQEGLLLAHGFVFEFFVANETVSQYF